MRASSSPEVISERRMKSSQTDWPSLFNSLILLMGALLEQDRRNGHYRAAGSIESGMGTGCFASVPGRAPKKKKQRMITLLELYTFTWD
jgi:hypothetical protein